LTHNIEAQRCADKPQGGLFGSKLIDDGFRTMKKVQLHTLVALFAWNQCA